MVAGGRNRVQVNRQPLRRARDLLGALRVTVFSPDDLALVKGGPGERRRYLDEALVAVHPRNDALRSGRRPDPAATQRAAEAGGRPADHRDRAHARRVGRQARRGRRGVGQARAALVSDLGPILAEAYGPVAQRAVAGRRRLRARLAARRSAAPCCTKADRTTCGAASPSSARTATSSSSCSADCRRATHASQGEQRSLALALRLAAHQVVTVGTGTSPVLLLDDVFSELDPDRCDALLANLPAGQTVLSTASGLPSGAAPGRVLTVRDGMVEEA